VFILFNFSEKIFYINKWRVIMMENENQNINVTENSEVTKAPERVMTIARGLTRLKTIKAQISSINDSVRKYAAWNNKKKHPLGDNKASVDKTLDQAQEEINSLYQQYNDLLEEYRKIKVAIDRTNMVTKIAVADKEMTIYEANLYRRDISTLVSGFVGAYSSAVNRAEREVEIHNTQYLNKDMNEDAKKVVMADVSYFISKDKVKTLDDFQTKFLSELDGTLNEVNALTPLIWE
jgi:chromosome segregation ATPase